MVKGVRSVVVALVLCAAMAPVAADEPLLNPSPPWRIQGTVVDARGLALPSVSVRTAQLATTTDANGNYEFRLWEPGTYVVSIHSSTVAPQTKAVTFVLPETKRADFTALYRVAATSALTTVTALPLTLPVRLAAWTGSAGVCARASGAGASGTLSFVRNESNGSSVWEGSLLVDAAPPGRHRLVAEAYDCVSGALLATTAPAPDVLVYDPGAPSATLTRPAAGRAYAGEADLGAREDGRTSTYGRLYVEATGTDDAGLVAAIFTVQWDDGSKPVVCRRYLSDAAYGARDTTFSCVMTSPDLPGLYSVTISVVTIDLAGRVSAPSTREVAWTV